MKKILFYCISFFLIFLTLEIACRLFYAFKDAQILKNPKRIIEKFYPSVINDTELSIKRDNGSIDVLFLGGSVIHPLWGDIEQKLADTLGSVFQKEVVVHNHSLSSNFPFERFQAKSLSYAKHTLPIELWGSFSSIHSGLIYHNEAIGSPSNKYSSNDLYIPVDINTILNTDIGNFDDVCHLSSTGCTNYVNGIVSSIIAKTSSGSI